jgi:hypothetical protein
LRFLGNLTSVSGVRHLHRLEHLQLCELRDITNGGIDKWDANDFPFLASVEYSAGIAFLPDQVDAEHLLKFLA